MATAQRRAEYPLPSDCATVDILTLVFDTDAAVLRKTAASVVAQDMTEWRWVIVDNGSTNAGTREVLRELAQHPNISIESLPRNEGIVAGHHHGLQLCTAEYVALLDHDDMLTADALRIVAWHVDRFDRPGFLYSDEDKCDLADRHFDPLIKPDFDPALIRDTAYTCHLSVAQRVALIDCGAFTDVGVEGTQDWDMALRLFESGCAIVHVPEILYSWRALESSTALALSEKPYVLDAQRHCLQQHLRRSGLDGRFEVVANPLFAEPNGHWRIRLRDGLPDPQMEIVEFVDEGAVAPGWRREAIGLLELIPDEALVTATRPDDPINAHFASCRHDTDVAGVPWVARASAISGIGISELPNSNIAAHLRSNGWRTLATPFLTAAVW